MADINRLKTQCLYYAVGHAPSNPNVRTGRYGLYAQSPFSPVGEIDLAASGFALACLPAAVSNGLVTYASAQTNAQAAAARIRSMIEKSAAATSATDIAKYGYKGMLYHYSTWNAAAQELQGNAGVEVSSIDTTLLMFGLLVCAQYFHGSVETNYLAARDAIDWGAWLDPSRNQIRMAYTPGVGFHGWWDWRTDETTLVNLMACMSDTNLDRRAIWNGWNRPLVTYTSPGPDPQSFTCHPTWFGDPFTLVYGFGFIDTARLPPDFNGVDWFEDARTAYAGHVEYFKKERGYTDAMTLCYFNGTAGVMAKPCSSPDTPVTRDFSVVFGVAGGLPFYDADPAENRLAGTLSKLVTHSVGFFQWTGWPAATVTATGTQHAAQSGAIIGQDIAFTALSIDNYLTHNAQNLVLRDPRMQSVLNDLFPPLCTSARIANWAIERAWSAVPFGAYRVQKKACSGDTWVDVAEVGSDANGRVVFSRARAMAAACFALSASPDYSTPIR